MSDRAGWIVRAVAGHDKGELFCVVGAEEDSGLLLLADGKRRHAAAPKRKKARHVEVLRGPEGLYDHPTIRKLKDAGPVTDRELRRALAAFKEENTLG